MDRDISSPQDLVAGFNKEAGGTTSVPVRGRWSFQVFRGVEGGFVPEPPRMIDNVVTAVGLNTLAALAYYGNTSSAFRYIAIGTVTAAASLGSTTFGEINRKVGATVTASNEVVILVNTFGGAADSLTGVALGSAAVTNHANSGQGQILNIVNSVDATLQASDLLRVQMEVQIGSHNL